MLSDKNIESKIEHKKEFKKDSKRVLINIIISIASAILLRGMALIIAPVITRIISPADYGLVVNFNTWFNIVSIFIGLQIGGSIQNMRLEWGNKRDQCRYFSNAMMIAFFSFVLFATIFSSLNGFFARTLTIEPILIHIMMPKAFGAFCIGFLASKFVAEKKPLFNFILALIVAVTTNGLAIAAMFVFISHQYIAFVVGMAVPSVAIGLGIFIYFLIKGKSLFNKTFWKFALVFSLPLIFHMLSNILLSSIDKIMIQNMISSEALAVYAIAFSLCSLVSLIWQAINSAFVPFYYDYLKENKIHLLRKRITILSFVFLILCIGFVYAVPEIVRLIFPSEYYDSIQYIPIIVLGNFFVALYTFTVNYEFYHKKTIWIAVGTLVAGCINVGLNFIFIPILGTFGAAITSMFAYFMLLIVHEFIARKVIKEYPIKITTHILPISIMLILTGLWYVFWYFVPQNLNWIPRWTVVVLVLVIIVYGIIKFKKESSRIKSYKRIERLFFASTPYNIFNAILLKEGEFKNESADIYISDFAFDNKAIADELSKLNIFNNVYFVKQKKYELWHLKYKNRYLRKFVYLLRRFNRMIFIEKNFCRMSGFKPDTVYKEYFYDTLCEAQMIVARQATRLNPDLRHIIYEVGTENYIHIKMLDSANYKKREVAKQFKGYNISAFYVHRPEICPDKLVVDTLIKKISAPDEKLKKIINKVYGFTEEHNKLLNEYDVVYLDSANEFDKDMMEAYTAITNVCYEVFEDKLIIKMHPRTEMHTYNDQIKLFDLRMSFEILAMNANDLDNKVFVSNNSTAALIPKLIFDKEPLLVQVRNIVDLNPILKKRYQVGRQPFNEELIDIYRDKDKIKNPQDYEALRQVLLDIKNNYENK